MDIILHYLALWICPSLGVLVDFFIKNKCPNSTNGRVCSISTFFKDFCDWPTNHPTGQQTGMRVRKKVTLPIIQTFEAKRHWQPPNRISNCFIAPLALLDVYLPYNLIPPSVGRSVFLVVWLLFVIISYKNGKSHFHVLIGAHVFPFPHFQIYFPIRFSVHRLLCKKWVE